MIALAGLGMGAIAGAARSILGLDAGLFWVGEIAGAAFAYGMPRD